MNCIDKLKFNDNFINDLFDDECRERSWRWQLINNDGLYIVKFETNNILSDGTKQNINFIIGDDDEIVNLNSDDAFRVIGNCANYSRRVTQEQNEWLCWSKQHKE